MVAVRGVVGGGVTGDVGGEGAAGDVDGEGAAGDVMGGGDVDVGVAGWLVAPLVLSLRRVLLGVLWVAVSSVVPMARVT